MDATAFVLAAGFGTRLRPLTFHRPKPLVPVCGVPMLAHALAQCARHGHTDVVVNTHHLSDALDAWARGPTEGVRVVLSPEQPDILGTGGGLRHARHLLAERFVVVNADVLCDADLGQLVGAVPEGGAAMLLRPHPEDAAAYGVVAADAEGVVVELADVAAAEPVGAVARDTHFTGLHALDRAALDRVPEGFACIVRTAYRDLVPQRRVRGVRHPGVWLDVGDPAAYLAANLVVLTTRVHVPLDVTARAAFTTGPRGTRGDPPPGVRIEGSCWIGPGARIEPGVVLRDTIVGDRAVLRDGTRLDRCVVWDGVEAVAGDWRDAIAHDGGWHLVGA